MPRLTVSDCTKRSVEQLSGFYQATETQKFNINNKNNKRCRIFNTDTSFSWYWIDIAHSTGHFTHPFLVTMETQASPKCIHTFKPHYNGEENRFTVHYANCIQATSLFI